MGAEPRLVDAEWPTKTLEVADQFHQFGLMADRIPTARGHSRWFPATIKAVTISDNAATLK